jgi:anti-sigma-K factor RskA
VAASVPLWLVLGFVASRRATRRALASWRDFWRELMWLTIAVVAGAALALAIATAQLGQSLVF